MNGEDGMPPEPHEPAEPAPGVTPPTTPPAGTAAISKPSRAGRVIKKVVIGLVALAAVGGLGFYIGWRMGYNANTPGPSPGCINIHGYCETPVLKPVIYLYPQRPEHVNVQLDYPAGLFATTPAYNPSTGWRVLAAPNGRLTDLGNGQSYPYLYWEGKPASINYDMSRGFVVAGDQTEAFFQRELPAIGLSPTETNAFISYWVPKMSGNRYNLIHFAGSEYTDYARLTVTPRPDSELRVFMAFEPLQRPVSVTPQTFSGFRRHGFAVVEWGGTELKP